MDDLELLAVYDDLVSRFGEMEFQLFVEMWADAHAIAETALAWGMHVDEVPLYVPMDMGDDC